jgi:hypothetical protein
VIKLAQARCIEVQGTLSAIKWSCRYESRNVSRVGKQGVPETNDAIEQYNIIRQIRSRRMRWAGHVARVGEERKVYKVLAGKPEGK